MTADGNPPGAEPCRFCEGHGYVPHVETEAQREQAIRLAQASNDWLLSLDCDEELSPELRDSILDWKRRTPEEAGYDFSRMTNYIGGWIRHCGWYPEYKLRLYRRDRGKSRRRKFHPGIQNCPPTSRPRHWAR
jgi:hypothetical protein